MSRRRDFLSVDRRNLTPKQWVAIRLKAEREGYAPRVTEIREEARERIDLAGETFREDAEKLEKRLIGPDRSKLPVERRVPVSV